MASTTAPRITYARLVEMLGDPDVPKQDLLPYIRQVSRPGQLGEGPDRLRRWSLGPVLEPSELVAFDDLASQQERANGDIGLGCAVIAQPYICLSPQ